MRAQDLPEVLRNEVEARRVYWDSQGLGPVQAKWLAVASGIEAATVAWQPQGFPDDYTNIPEASDSARYHALGNSMAVPVMRWIGARIAEVAAI